jgi:hypothetical protein
MTEAWYYVENDVQAGPVSIEQLRRFLSSSRGGKAVLVWRSGFSAWEPAGEVDELADVFERPRPDPRTPNDAALLAVGRPLGLDFGNHGDAAVLEKKPQARPNPASLGLFFLFVFLAGVFVWGPELIERKDTACEAVDSWWIRALSYFHDSYTRELTEGVKARHGMGTTEWVNDIYPHWPSWLACDYVYWNTQIAWQFTAR